jgi:hypothetical protein
MAMLPFSQLIPDQSITTVVGNLDQQYTYGTICSDLSGASNRLVRLNSIIVRFQPVPSTADVFVQIIYVDVVTANPLPITAIKSLNRVNQTVLRARFPRNNIGWFPAGSAVGAFILRFNSPSTYTVNYAIEGYFSLVRDYLA